MFALNNVLEGKRPRLVDLARESTRAMLDTFPLEEARQATETYEKECPADKDPGYCYLGMVGEVFERLRGVYRASETDPRLIELAINGALKLYDGSQAASLDKVQSELKAVTMFSVMRTPRSVRVFVR